MKNIDKKVLRNLLNHKGQYIAITILIAMGITIFLSFNMAVYNLEDTVDTYYNDYGLADIYVKTNNASNELEIIKGYESVANAHLRGHYEAKAIFENSAKLKVLTETNPINKLYIERGSSNINKNEALLFAKFADARNIKVGDNINIRLNGNEYNFKIKGLVYSPEFIYLTESERVFLPDPKDYGVIYISDNFMKEAYGKNYYNEIVIKARENIDINNLKEIIKNGLDKNSIYTVSTKEEQLAFRAAEEEIRGEIAMSQSMPILFLIIAAAIMALVVSKLVENERMEIGILKAMGYSNNIIILSYIKLTLIIGTIGALSGMLLGGLISYQFTKFYTAMFELPILVYHFELKYLLIAFGIAVGVSVFSGVFGARKVLKLLPQESMKPKAPVIGKHSIIERLNLYKKLKYTNKLVVKNIVRQKRRFILTIVGISVSFAMLLSPFAFYNLMNTMFIEQYKKVQVMDYDIKFKNVIDSKGISKVEEYTNGYVEGYLELPVDIINNERKNTINIIGLVKDTKIYNLQTIDGKKANITKDAFYISEGFANANNINKGDDIELNILFGDNIKGSIKVTNIVKQKLGSNAYVEINKLYEIFGLEKILEKEHYTGAYIQGNINEKEIENTGLVSSITSTDKIIELYKEFTDLIYFSLSALVIFGGIIAFVIVYVVSIMNINERKTELSTLRVLGFTKKEIFNIITRENMLASIIGIILGVPLGIWMINYVSNSFSNDLYSLSMDYTFNMFIYSGAFTILFVLIGQRITKAKIKKLNLIETLKNRIT